MKTASATTDVLAEQSADQDGIAVLDHDVAGDFGGGFGGNAIGIEGAAGIFGMDFHADVAVITDEGSERQCGAGVEKLDRLRGCGGSDSGSAGACCRTSRTPCCNLRKDRSGVFLRCACACGAPSAQDAQNFARKVDTRARTAAAEVVADADAAAVAGAVVGLRCQRTGRVRGWSKPS